MSSPLVPSDLLKIVIAADPQIAPDGGAVFYRRAGQDRDADETRGAIHRVDRDGRDRAFTRGTNDRLPRVAPDGATLAFVAERDGAARIYLLSLAGGEAIPLGPGYAKITALAWSPDARRLAFVATAAHDPRTARGYLDERSGARHYRALPFKSDSDGLLDGVRKHLFVVDVSGEGEPRQLTQGDFDVGAPAWSPDGARLAFTARIDAPESAIALADLCTIDASGGELQRLTHALGPAAAPSYARDGSEIAYIGHLHGDDGGGRFDEELLVIAAGGGTPRSLSARLGRTVGDHLASDLRGGHAATAPLWLANDAEIAVMVCDEGATVVRAFARDGASSRILAGGERHVFGLSAARDGTLAIAYATPTVPNEIALVAPGGAERVLTDLNPWLAEKIVVEPRRYRPRAADGTTLDGWLIAPPDAEPVPPLVLEVHGGPHAAYGATFFFEFQLLAASGIAVAYGNPRGSQSYGHAYANAILGRWGALDAGDVLSILDGALALGTFDTARLGVAGGSYGGFMTTWLLGHSERFAAGVSMRAVNDFVSEVGASDVGWFLETELGTGMRDDAGRGLFERSPMRAAAAIRVPLLVEHSERDYRCPIDQGEQLFTLLRRLGRVDAEFVRFADTGHEMSRSGKPRSRVLRLRAIAQWFVRYLRPAGGVPVPDEAGALFRPLPGEDEA